MSGLSSATGYLPGAHAGFSLPPPPAAYAASFDASTQAMQSAVMSAGLTTTSSAAAETLSLFEQLQAHRQRRRHREEQQQPVVTPTQTAEPATTSSANSTRCYHDTCTICLERFAAGDHCCRLVCRHVFHCLCVGEYLQHSTLVEEPQLEMTCPNCRNNTRVDVSWFQPNFNLQGSHPMPEQAQEDEACARQYRLMMRRCIQWQSMQLQMDNRRMRSHGGRFLRLNSSVSTL